MVRRLRIALLVALGLVLTTALVVVGGASLLLRTDWGQRLVQARVEAALAGAVQSGGRVALHGLSLAPLGTVSLDSLTLSDSAGRRVVSVGAVSADFALGPLLDREARIRLLRIERPEATLTQDRDGRWDIATMFGAAEAAGTSPALTPRGGWRFTTDSVHVSDAEVRLIRPDTAGRTTMRADTVRSRTVALGATRLDLGTRHGEIRLAHLDATATAPPVDLRHAEGGITLWRDSLRTNLTRLELPASHASLTGTVAWNDASGDPRLDLVLRADTLGFADVAWLSELVPPDGVGRATVAIGNGPAPGVIRYGIRDFRLGSGTSSLAGRFVADVGHDVALRDLDVTADPLDLDLVRTLFGDSVPPPPWDGTLRGRLRASGGSLDAWHIEPSTLEFEDRRIGGARSRFTIAGTLDLLADDVTLAPLDVIVDSLDVRTVGAVVDVADSLRGYLAGRVQLQGPVRDIAFRDLSLAHHDGALPRTVVRGDGRLALDTSTTWLEAHLTFDAVGLAALGKAFVDEPLAGTLEGTVAARARGDSVALEVAFDGEGAALRFTGATTLDTARLALLGDLQVTRLDARRFFPGASLPAHRLTATASLGIDGLRGAPSGPVAVVLDATSELAGLTIRDGRASLALEPGGLRVDTLAFVGPFGAVAARGRLSRDPALRDSLRFDVTVDSVALLRGLLPDSLATAWADSLGGRGRLAGVALGSLDTLDIRATLVADSVHAGSHAVARVDGELLLDGVPHATHGLVSFEAAEVVAGGVPIARLRATATVREPTWTDASLHIVAGDTLVADARADIRWRADTLTVHLDSLDATTRNARWALRRPARLVKGPAYTTLDSLELRSDDGGRFVLAMRLEPAGPIALQAYAERVPLSHARFTGLMPTRLDGLVSVDADLSGTRDAPRLTLTATLDSARVDGVPIPRLALEASYADLAANVTLAGQTETREAFRVTGELPVDLRLQDRRLADRLVDAPVYVRLSADGSPLAAVQGLVPGFRELQGAFDAQLQVTGGWRSLEPRGYLILRDGAFAVPALGTGFREFDLDIALAPDSIVLHRARLADERSRGDTATLTGAVVRTPDGWRASIESRARSLRLIDDPRVAEADVSWLLRLDGPLDSLRLAGTVSLPTANIYIGQQRRRVLALSEDIEAPNEAARYAPRLQGVQVRLGNEVRLRSPEANVQLTGAVEVAGSLDAPDVRGEIVATRGTYRLDLGLLQRTFQVDSGRVRMNGPLSNSPSLNIHTSYLVRQADRDDVRIFARLIGTVEEPRLILSSADVGSTANDTELISYLLFGAPSFVLDGQSASAVRLATAALVPSLGGAAERALGGRIPFISELQVTTVAGDSPRDFTLNSFEGLLNSFALTAGTQIGTDSYLRLSAGVCRGENRAAQSLPAWFGIAAEYRPVERLSAQVSLTPGSAPCNRIGSFSQIYQFGLDLFRDWRW